MQEKLNADSQLLNNIIIRRLRHTHLTVKAYYGGSSQ